MEGVRATLSEDAVLYYANDLGLADPDLEATGGWGQGARSVWRRASRPLNQFRRSRYSLPMRIVRLLPSATETASGPGDTTGCRGGSSCRTGGSRG